MFKKKVLASALVFTLLSSALSFSISPQKVKATPDYANIVGVTHADGKYAFDSTKDYLNEGADRLVDLGTKVIKLWFTPDYKNMYKFNSNWPTVTNLRDLAATTYYSNAFNKFNTIVLEAYEFSGYDFHYGLSTTQVATIKSEFYELTKYLLNTYKNTNKTFILQNWEGDNAMGSGYSATAVQGMIDWANARMDGIIQARNEVGETGVRVMGAFEINKVSTTYNNNPKLVDVVVPYTHMDLYSYSNYEVYGDMRNNLDYIASKAPDDGRYGYGNKNVYLGEYGKAENRGGEQAQRDAVQSETDYAILWGCPYLIYWELYCNERTSGDASVRPTNSEMAGWWLIRPDGSRPAVYYYMADLFYSKKAFVDYCGDFSKVYSKTSGLAVDSSNSQNFEGDTGRIYRTSNTDQYVIYKMNNMYNFNIKMNYYGSVGNKLHVYASKDNVSWVEIPLSWDSAVSTGNGWYRQNFWATSNMYIDVNYVKVLIHDDVNAWNPQIGQVNLYYIQKP